MIGNGSNVVHSSQTVLMIALVTLTVPSLRHFGSAPWVTFQYSWTGLCLCQLQVTSLALVPMRQDSPAKENLKQDQNHANDNLAR